MYLKVLITLYILVFFRDAFAGHFAVVGPRTVQFGADYTAFLSFVGNSDQPMNVNLALEGIDGEEFDEKSMELTYHTSESVTFKLADSPIVQDYRLIVTADNDFMQSVRIHTIVKKYSVLIQTDKAIYKSGDKIQIRVLVLDAETKPYSFKSLRLTIIDAYGNVVHETEHDNDLVLEDHHEITEDPFLGEWTLKVQIDDDDIDTAKTFEVSEYDLPLFEAFIETNKHVTLSDKTIKLSIFARYNFGEYVKGKAKVTTRLFDFKFPNILLHDPPHTRLVNDILGSKQTYLDLKNDLKVLQAIRDIIAVVEVEFEEELTKKKMFVNETVTIRKRRDFKIQIVRPQLHLKPGFPYKVNVVVRTSDGGFEKSGTRPVMMKAQFHYSLPKCTVKGVREESRKGFEHNSEKILVNGGAEFILAVPHNTSAMVLSVSYLEAQKTVNVVRFPSKSRDYLVANLVSKGHRVNKEVVIRIESSIDLVSIALHALVIGRTGIVFNQTNSFPLYTFDFDLKFKATTWMVPEAQVLIYYIHYTGEIVYDKLAIEFEDELPNKLEILPNGKSIKPGKDLTLKPGAEARFTLKSTNGSTVYLLGVDRSLNLLKTGNDISKDGVFKEFMAYNKYKNYGPLHINGTDDGRYSEIGASNAYFITNAYDGYTSCVSERSGSQGKLEYEANTDDDVELTDDEEGIEELEPTSRKDFPETWIFEKVEVNHNGVAYFTKILPDTITSWDITGFALSGSTGLGIAEPQKLIVSQRFFLMVSLPFSIRVNEILRVDVSVFSYIPEQTRDLEVDVILYNESKPKNDDESEEDAAYYDDDDVQSLPTEFDFYNASLELGNCVYRKVETKLKMIRKRIKIGKNAGASTSFFIKATKPGNRMVKVRAEIVRNRKKFDEVEKMLKVEHEGLTEYRNKALLIDLRNKPRDGYDFDIFISEAALKSSIKINAAVIGDLIGPALSSTENLIRIPSGCYEQRLKDFVPNVVALNYLNATKRLTTEKRKLGEDALRKGVEQALETRITEGEKKGAFSIWNRKSLAPSDSIWLTAYVVKCFGKAKHLISIQDQYLFEALDFLKKHQEDSGKFPEYGRVSYYNLQSDSSEGIPLTAFTVIAFLENRDYVDRFNHTIHKALDYIDRKFSNLTDNYALSIATYALALGKHPSAVDFLKELMEKALQEGDSMVHWEKEMDARKKGSKTTASTKVEMAAYAILAHVKLGKAHEAVPIVNWLISQRNANGGFYSTHDTVIGIQALGEVAAELYSDNVNMDIKLTLDKGPVIEFRLNQENRISPQSFNIIPTARVVTFNAHGSGIASLQVSHSYNTKLVDAQNYFNLTVKVVPSTRENILHMDICTNYYPQREDDGNKTGMVLLEVAFPSGYVFDPDSDLLSFADIKKYELRNEKTTVVLYFDSIDSSDVCSRVQAIRQKVVNQLKPSPVKIFDYYAPEKRAIEYYLPTLHQSC